MHYSHPIRYRLCVPSFQVIPAGLYAAEMWGMNERNLIELQIAVMKVFRAIRGKTSWGRVRNAGLRANIIFLGRVW